MTTVRSFHKYRGESSFTLPGLVAVLREQIPLVVPSQTKYRVTDVPTERTIRFYTVQGLVDKPLDREGTRALYGYRHLLQILAVKYLQSHYLPLVKVRSLVENVSNRDLELLIPDIPPQTAAHRGFAREDRRVIGRALRHQPSGAAAPVPAVSGASPGTPESPGDPGPEAWHHIEVAPGIELHVLAAALRPQERERLRGALLRELAALRGWRGEGA